MNLSYMKSRGILRVSGTRTLDVRTMQMEPRKNYTHYSDESALRGSVVLDVPTDYWYWYTGYSMSYSCVPRATSQKLFEILS
jgi:hypothetical protein